MRFANKTRFVRATVFAALLLPAAAFALLDAGAAGEGAAEHTSFDFSASPVSKAEMTTFHLAMLSGEKYSIGTLGPVLAAVKAFDPNSESDQVKARILLTYAHGNLTPGTLRAAYDDASRDYLKKRKALALEAARLVSSNPMSKSKLLAASEELRKIEGRFGFFNAGKNNEVEVELVHDMAEKARFATLDDKVGPDALAMAKQLLFSSDAGDILGEGGSHRFVEVGGIMMPERPLLERSEKNPAPVIRSVPAPSRTEIARNVSMSSFAGEAVDKGGEFARAMPMAAAVAAILHFVPAGIVTVMVGAGIGIGHGNAFDFLIATMIAGTILDIKRFKPFFSRYPVLNRLVEGLRKLSWLAVAAMWAAGTMHWFPGFIGTIPIAAGMVMGAYLPRLMTLIYKMDEILEKKFALGVVDKSVIGEVVSTFAILIGYAALSLHFHIVTPVPVGMLLGILLRGLLLNRTPSRS